MSPLNAVDPKPLEAIITYASNEGVTGKGGILGSAYDNLNNLPWVIYVFSVVGARGRVAVVLCLIGLL